MLFLVCCRSLLVVVDCGCSLLFLFVVCVVRSCWLLRVVVVLMFVFLRRGVVRLAFAMCLLFVVCCCCD